MKLNDQTAREREKLNRGLGDIQREAKKAREETNRSIVDIAKASKQNMEGLKAVLELGGWLMMAKEVGRAVAEITKEARANSAAFKEAGAALSVVKSEIGQGIVKALEPLAEGFTDVLLTGTAVFKNFPEVAKLSFGLVGDVLKRALAPEGFVQILSTISQMVVQAFLLAFQRIPVLMGDLIEVLGGKFVHWLRWLDAQATLLGKGKFKEMQSYEDYSKGTPQKTFGGVATDFGGYIGGQLSGIASGFKTIAANYSDLTAAFGQGVDDVIGPTLAELKKRTTIANPDKPDAYAMPGSTDLAAAPKDLLLQNIMSFDGVARALEDRINAGMRDLPKLNAEARAAAVAAVKEMAAAVRDNNLSGRAGLGAAVKENLAGTEILKFAATGGQAAAAGADPMAAIMGSTMSQLFGSLAAFLPTIGNLMALLNPLQTILGAVFEVLGPVINNLLAPLVGILKIIGYTIGKILAPALELLRPIITFLAELFTWVYNKVYVPIGNAIITVFNVIYNSIAGFVNAILLLVDQIPFVDVGRVEFKALDSGHLSEITTDMVGAAGGTAGGSGGSASYAAGTSIKIDKIEVSAGIVVGRDGLDEFALIVRDRISELAIQGR